ncbi:MAG: TrmH family RNA methyltransferase [Candidatus Saccharimonadales bacterium]
MRKLVLIAHDIRSTHNVGSLLRTAEGLGVTEVYFTGYTPYPKQLTDDRLPFIADKLDKQIHKTALGAEQFVVWSHSDSATEVVEQLRTDGFQIIGLEQSADSINLPDFQPPEKVAILLGREVDGIDPALLKLCDRTVEIPMYGQKESFNVVQAAAMALYHCRFA